MAFSTSFKIDTFSGLSSEISPENFLDIFHSYSTVQNFETDIQKVAAFHLHLRGEALAWFNALESKTSWSTVKDAFTRRFINANPLNAPDMVSAMHSFQTICLCPGQALSDYYILICEKAKALQKTDAETILRFVDGLPSELKFFVRAGSPKSLEEAFTAARNGEVYGYRSPQSCGHVPSSRPASLETRVDALSQQVTELTQLLNSQSFGSPRFPNGSQRSPASTSQRDRTVCGRCRCPGHTSSECNLATNGRPRPDLRCFKCGQFSHGSKFCKSNQEN